MLLKKDGTLRHHGGPIGTGGIFRKRAYHCTGADGFPTQVRELTDNTERPTDE